MKNENKLEKETKAEFGCRRGSPQALSVGVGLYALALSGYVVYALSNPTGAKEIENSLREVFSEPKIECKTERKGWRYDLNANTAKFEDFYLNGDK